MAQKRHKIGRSDVLSYDAARQEAMPITDSGEVWWSDVAPSQRALYGSYVVLGEAFFRAITSNPVPVDRRALKALRRSPLALDLYAWATHRVYELGSEGAFIPWSGLRRQIGAAYSDPKNFQKAAKQALRKVASVYLGFRYSCELGGIRILLGSTTAVPSNKSGKSSHIHGETVPRPTAAPPKARGVTPRSRR
ncbi:hypothetical protein amb4026 [Paramagnetospirillum magneticum AMB-1]|uniref:Plasmid encoded RepA protein n=2 Tax=Paramagnetospirillum magneticum TaxID=84159 RepID=Q2VZZ5_PARM1|nr:hypothetical protein amb4026 [Paramagnetospirillum magneticum AMB-1]